MVPAAGGAAGTCGRAAPAAAAICCTRVGWIQLDPWQLQPLSFQLLGNPHCWVTPMVQPSCGHLWRAVVSMQHLQLTLRNIIRYTVLVCVCGLWPSVSGVCFCSVRTTANRHSVWQHSCVLQCGMLEGCSSVTVPSSKASPRGRWMGSNALEAGSACVPMCKLHCSAVEAPGGLPWGVGLYQWWWCAACWLPPRLCPGAAGPAVYSMAEGPVALSWLVQLRPSVSGCSYRGLLCCVARAGGGGSSHTPPQHNLEQLSYPACLGSGCRAHLRWCCGGVWSHHWLGGGDGGLACVGVRQKHDSQGLASSSCQLSRCLCVLLQRHMCCSSRCG